MTGLTLEEAIRTYDDEGETIAIDYRHATIVVPRYAVFGTIENLSQIDPNDAGPMIASANEYLTRHFDEVMDRSKEPDHEMAFGMTKAVIVWFANEVLEGRRSIDTH